MSLSKNPTYNLKAVLKETGLKADVLRAWERRYGLPAPERTQGGHRLYSEFDMALLKWLLLRQAEGLSISRAAEMWKEQLLLGHDPLAETALTAKTPGPAPLTTGIEALRAGWLAACLEFNEAAAEQTLNQAFALYPVETVCTAVLQRGLAEMGNLWYENRASIQQEHFASALAMRRLDTLLAASPAPTRPQTVLIGCPAAEWHTFTPLLLALFLRRNGLNVIYLGANVPATCLAETVTMVKADLVILAAQQLISAGNLQEAVGLMAARGATVAFGGRIFSLQPDLGTRIAGHYLGDRLDSALQKVETLLAGKPVSPQPVSPSTEYMQTLAAFQANRPLIEGSLDAEARASGLNPAYLETSHKFMGDNILACLRLGEMTYLDSEIDWLTVLLQGLNLPRDVVYAYLRLYSAAVYRHLDGHAAPITDWLDRQPRNF
jgi:DNA-binding transcriptional MerR regulator/methylmalonyl-CoA mutase cobalamin-binding subunit